MAMFGRLSENQCVKCEQYWPLIVGETAVYGNFEVANVGTEVLKDFTVTVLEVGDKRVDHH